MLGKVLDWIAVTAMSGFLGWFAAFQAAITYPNSEAAPWVGAILIGFATGRIASRSMRLIGRDRLHHRAASGAEDAAIDQRIAAIKAAFERGEMSERQKTAAIAKTLQL